MTKSIRGENTIYGMGDKRCFKRKRKTFSWGFVDIKDF